MVEHSIPYKDHLVGWWCIVRDGQIYLSPPKQKLPFGTLEDLNLSDLKPKVVHRIGEFENDDVYWLDIEAADATAIGIENDFTGIRDALFKEYELFEFITRAVQLSLFVKTHKFCGQCGQQTELVDWELASLCIQCHHRSYPRISPCVIVAITKGNQLLLAQGKRSVSGMYSLIAGFVESGETLEQAAHREVLEEVGIRIKNLKYVSSQPWPFPHSLMVGFTAEYDGGTITPCEHEILDADWFTLGEFPATPTSVSIAGKIIEHVKKRLIRAS